MPILVVAVRENLDPGFFQWSIARKGLLPKHNSYRNSLAPTLRTKSSLKVVGLIPNNFLKVLKKLLNLDRNVYVLYSKGA
jgi:hypothetical protein